MTEQNNGGPAFEAPGLTDLVGGPTFWPYTDDFLRHLLAENGVPDAMLAAREVKGE